MFNLSDLDIVGSQTLGGCHFHSGKELFLNYDSQIIKYNIHKSQEIVRWVSLRDHTRGHMGLTWGWGLHKWGGGGGISHMGKESHGVVTYGTGHIGGGGGGHIGGSLEGWGAVTWPWGHTKWKVLNNVYTMQIHIQIVLISPRFFASKLIHNHL